jgi:glycyl-tRNA synthetase beta chain
MPDQLPHDEIGVFNCRVNIETGWIMVAELVLEIGTEEIPSGYLGNGLRELGRLADACLRNNRIEIAGDLLTYGTPRRLVLIGKAIAKTQVSLMQEITGPPKSVAYDTEGRPTKAALGFAQKQGVSVEELGYMETSKGEYLTVKKQIPGRRTLDVLAEVLPELIAGIPWPKSMRWGTLGFSFVRPIHWVLALFDSEVIPFETAGVRSGNTTRGHRFMAPAAMEVFSVQDYLQKMGESFVQINQNEREARVEAVTRKAAKTAGGMPSQDPELVTTVANLVEYPSAVCGSFDAAFLNLPAPVLITAMKEHQRYFAVYDGNGKLMPNFVAVNNTLARDASVVRRGHERVLRARLSDAEFFFKEDRKRSLADRIENLKGVIYQAELGTSYAKVQRFTRLAEFLGEQVLPDALDGVRLCARLCKCDLLTQMVTEFPTLQGVMGAEYARMEGYPEAVSTGIQEHYLPTGAGGRLPTSEIGAVVGLADRMDTITGCFAIGLEPSGSADPFALRRHALAVIRIVEEMGWDISLQGFIEKGLSLLIKEVAFDRDSVFERVVEFFRERYRQMMLRSGYASDFIEAVISTEFDRIYQIRSRIDHLKRFASESREFHELALTFKRVTNILKRQERTFEVAPELFKEPCESALWEIYLGLRDDVYRCLDNRNYYEALTLMARLKPPVDELFDGVEILTQEDQIVSQNRIGLLQHLARLFFRVADFSKFSI